MFFLSQVRLIVFITIVLEVAEGRILNYVIFPKDGANPAEVTRITQSLRQYVHPDELFISASTFLRTTFFWYGPMSDSQVATFKQIHVDIVWAVKSYGIPRLQTRDTHQPKRLNKINRTITSLDEAENRSSSNGIVFEVGAFDELKVISQPVGATLNDQRNKGFYYDDSAGRDTMVYMLERGVDPYNSDLAFLSSPIRWLYAGPYRATGSTHDPDGAQGHGTCMVTKIAGRICGIAKQTQITLVRILGRFEDPAAPFKTQPTEQFIDALVVMYDDIRANGWEGRAVFQIAVGIRISESESIDYRAAFENAMSVLFRELTALNVVGVVAAGNSGSAPIDSIPQMVAKSVPKMILVGGVYTNGSQHPQAQRAPWVRVSAPYQNRCALVGSGFLLSRGTSGAASAVTGVVADFLTLGYPPQDIPEMIYSLAYPRCEGCPNTVWNGVDYRHLTNGSYTSTIDDTVGNDTLDLGRGQDILPASHESSLMDPPVAMRVISEASMQSGLVYNFENGPAGNLDTSSMVEMY